MNVKQNFLVGQKTSEVWKWWVRSAKNLSVLTQLSEEILLIPATSASSERSFSKASRLKSLERMSLKAGTLEDMMALAGNLTIEGA
jgi:hypothetical protein